MTAQALSYPVLWAVRFGAFFDAGLILGLLYFQGLWWNARQMAGGRLNRAMLLTAGRFALLGAALTLASRNGAPPLLSMTLGILAARAAVMRRIGKITP